MAQINKSIGIDMLQKFIISLVMLAVILSLFTSDVISAALALFAFLLILYYSLNDTNKANN